MGAYIAYTHFWSLILVGGKTVRSYACLCRNTPNRGAVHHCAYIHTHTLPSPNRFTGNTRVDRRTTRHTRAYDLNNGKSEMAMPPRRSRPTECYVSKFVFLGSTQFDPLVFDPLSARFLKLSSVGLPPSTFPPRRIVDG